MTELDPQTGLPGALAFQATLDAALAPRRGALVELALDGFTPWLDTYGLGAGEAMLRALGEALNGVRPPDAQVFRPRAESFAVWLSDADLVGAIAQARRMMQAIGAVSVGGAPITASAGLTVPAATDAGWLDLVARTAEALYRAEEDGPGRMRAALLVSSAAYTTTDERGLSGHVRDDWPYTPVITRSATPTGVTGQEAVPLDGFGLPALHLHHSEWTRRGQTERLSAFRLGGRPLVVEEAFTHAATGNLGTSTSKAAGPPAWIGQATQLVEAIRRGELAVEPGQAPGTVVLRARAMDSGAVYNTVVYVHRSVVATLDVHTGRIRLENRESVDTST